MAGCTASGAQEHEEQMANMFDAGRRTGYAVSALVLSLVTFLSLLGAEKAILAIVLGALAVRGSTGRNTATRLGTAAIIIAAVFLAAAAVLLMVFRSQLVEIVEMLNELS